MFLQATPRIFVSSGMPSPFPHPFFPHSTACFLSLCTVGRWGRHVLRTWKDDATDIAVGTTTSLQKRRGIDEDS